MCTCHTTVHVYALHNIFVRLCVIRPVPRLVVIASFPDHPFVHDLGMRVVIIVFCLY